MTAVRTAPVGALIVLALACARNDAPDPAPIGDGGQIVTSPVVDLACVPSGNMPVEGRQSPYDSTTVDVAGQALRICYGRPSAQGREIFGGLVPWGTLWRTGANEPTILHVPFDAEIAGLTGAARLLLPLHGAAGIRRVGADHQPFDQPVGTSQLLHG
jgi:hypothetical protein